MLSVLECGGPLGVVGDMSLLVDVVAAVDGVGLSLDICRCNHWICCWSI